MPGVSGDAFVGGRIGVLQPETGHRAGSDTVFLAAAVEAYAGQHVLDAGAGVGAAGLCLLTRVPEALVTAAEIDGALCSLAAANAERNGFARQFTVIEVDLTAPMAVLQGAGLARERYDHVIVNPPFYDQGSVRAAPNAAKATAHVMPPGDLERWVRALTTMAAPKATLTLIYRAEHLAAVLPLLEGRFGDLTIFPLYPKQGEPAARVIVRGRKGSRARLRLLPGLVLHEADGTYCPKAEAILRGGEALRLDTP